MPTIEEILRQTGFTDDQIKGLDPRAVNAFSGVLTAAEQERKNAVEAAARAESERKAAADAAAAAKARQEKAELVERSNREFYDGTIVTALNSWEDEKKKIESERAKAAAEAAFYRTQAETAKSAGFIPAEAPAFSYTPPANDPALSRDPGTGRYVAGAPGGTPGSPTLVDDVRTAFSDSTWAMQEHQRLFGTFIPDDITILAREAEATKLPFRDYVARKYNYSGRRDELSRAAQQKHDEEVRAAAAQEYEAKMKAQEEEYKQNLEKARQEWAERAGSNPDVRSALPSRMQEVQRAVKSGDRPDPLKMSNSERHQITRKQINERIAEQEVGQPA